MPSDDTNGVLARGRRHAATFRFPSYDIVERIDRIRATWTVPISRNAWIMRAIVDELERQEGQRQERQVEQP